MLNNCQTVQTKDHKYEANAEAPRQKQVNFRRSEPNGHDKIRNTVRVVILKIGEKRTMWLTDYVNGPCKSVTVIRLHSVGLVMEKMERFSEQRYFDKYTRAPDL